MFSGIFWLNIHVDICPAMANPAPATLLLVDDQVMLLDGMEALLATIPSVRMVGRSSSGMEAVEIGILARRVH